MALRLLALILILACGPAIARMGGIAAPPPPAAVVQTLTLVSTSGSTVTANTPSPPMFGLQFPSCTIDAAHCVPTGQYPQLQATDGTPWPATFLNRSSWSDGSIKHISVLPGPFPKAVPTTGATANVLSGGSAPAASGLTTASLYAELMQVNANGFAGALGTGLGLQGNWSAKLANDTNKVEEVTYGDGGGGRVYRILTHVQSGGTPHGQMEVYWYVQQLLNASGGLAGYRVLPRLTQPWYDVNIPAKDWRGLQAFNIQVNGGTPIVPPFPYLPLSFEASTWTGSRWIPTDQHLSWYTCPSQESCPVPGYLSSSGALPTGLSGTTVYCMSAASSIQVSFSNCDGTYPSYSDGGTGTLTFTPTPLLPHFGTLWGAQANGKYQYIQGSGTIATDAPIIIQRDPAALVATRVYPPFDTTLSPTPNPNPATIWGRPAGVFDIMTIGPLALNNLGVSDRDDIGILNGWQVRHFYNQTLLDDGYVRSLGFLTSLWANSIRARSTLGLINLNDPAKSYAGMPASLATSFEWPHQYSTEPFTLPIHGGSQLFFVSNNFSHQAHLAGYAYLVTGEPQFLDLELEDANHAIFARAVYFRNQVHSGTTYYATVLSDGGWSFRDMAWSIREVNYASILAPDTDPAGTGVKQYFSDILNSNVLVPPLVLGEQNAYTASIGLWMPLDDLRQEYMMQYLTLALGQVATSSESAGALSILQDITALYYNHLYTLTGNSYSLYSYATYAYDTGVASGALPWVGGTLTWSSAGGGTVTLVTGDTINELTGMRILINPTNPAYIAGIPTHTYGGVAYGAPTITVVDPHTFTYHLASDPGGTDICNLCKVTGTLITDDAHLVLDFAQESGPADGVGAAFWTQWRAGLPGTFSKNYLDYSGANGAGGAVWHPADGDKILFPPYNSNLLTNPQPTGLSWATPYYVVNTHFGSLATLAWSSTAGGTLNATTTSPHGLSAGTYNIGFNGTAPAGYQWSYNCTVTGASSFTCPTSLGDFGTVTYPGTYNTFNLAASPGGTAIAISDSGLINNNFKSGMLPADPPPNWIGTNYPNGCCTGGASLAVGSINYMAAVGVTGISAFVADANARFAATYGYFGFTKGTYYQANAKWAMGGSF